MRVRWVSFLFAVLIAGTAWLYYQAFVHDAPLTITPQTVAQLQALRAQAKFVDLPGRDTRVERARNEGHLNELLDRLIQGIERHPSKRWVILQMAPTVDQMYLEDTEARERFIDYLEAINQGLGISSTDGAFAFRFIFF